jgi:hypothetical protein
LWASLYLTVYYIELKGVSMALKQMHLDIFNLITQSMLIK